MLTPPDPFSQIVMAVPLIGLYEISILISGVVKNIQMKIIIGCDHAGFEYKEILINLIREKNFHFKDSDVLVLSQLITQIMPMLFQKKF